MTFDFVICGDGPAASFAAEFACPKNDVALIGDGVHKVKCAGLISKSGFKRLGIRESDYILNKIYGARIVSPGGVEFNVRTKEPKAYVVDRMSFDDSLFNRALDLGATHILGHADKVNDLVHLTDGRKIMGKKIVVATGSNFTLHHNSGFAHPKKFLLGGQYEMKIDGPTDLVELFFDIPDFFSWIIPLGDGVARIGLAQHGNPRPLLDSFIKKLKNEGRITNDKIFSESFGIIPLFDSKLKTTYGKTMLLGDAAGQLKATTGGGIIMGGLAAKYIVKPGYETLWRREIESELKMHLHLHNFINRLSPKGKDRFFSIVRDSHEVLEEVGDMDMAKKTVFGMVKNPKVLSKTLLNLPFILADIL